MPDIYSYNVLVRVDIDREAWRNSGGGDRPSRAEVAQRLNEHLGGLPGVQSAEVFRVYGRSTKDDDG
ncbi:hypothetical protein ACPA54_15130 [Uniformispora flossi]|uniref:hypothetical protein n=1 Tax=Uniformispora flossi TaxID=3390723 RepID=UPI003C2CB497